MTKINKPKSYNDVTVGHFEQLHPAFSAEGSIHHRLSVQASKLWRVSISHFNHYTFEDYVKLSEELSWLSDWDKPREFSNEIVLDGKVYMIDPNLNNVTGGQYMSVMQTLSKCLNPDGEVDMNMFIPNLANILANFIFETETKGVWPFRKYVKVPFNAVDYEQMVERVREHMTVEQAFPIALFFLDFFQQLNRDYKRIFEPDDSGSGEDGYELGEGWGWYVTLDNLTGSRPWQWEYFESMNVIGFLNILLYYKEKQVVANKNHKLAKLRSGL